MRLPLVSLAGWMNQPQEDVVDWFRGNPTAVTTNSIQACSIEVEAIKRSYPWLRPGGQNGDPRIIRWAAGYLLMLGKSAGQHSIAMDLADIAEARFREGYSCSQSVFSALAERWNIDLNVSLRIAAGFGGGLARSARTCGCVTGGIMAIGLAQRGISPEENRSEREKTYEAAQRFMRAFEERNCSTFCPELLGCNISTPEGLAEARQKGLFESRCRKLVRDAVEIVQGMLTG